MSNHQSTPLGFLDRVKNEFSFASTSLSLVVLQPIETAKMTLLGQKERPTSGLYYRSPYDFLKRTTKTTPLSLWSGTLPNLAIKVPTNFTLYYANVVLRDFFKWNKDHYSFMANVSREASLGILSGITSSVLIHHLELAVAMSHGKSDVEVLSNLPSMYATIVKSNGWRGLLRYNLLTTAQFGVFGGVYFSIHRMFPKYTFIGILGTYPSLAIAHKIVLQNDIVLDFVSSYSSCLAATVLAHPFDVVKTRLFFSLKSENTTYDSMFDLILKIYKSEGFRGFKYLWRLGVVQAFSGASLMFLYERFLL